MTLVKAEALVFESSHAETPMGRDNDDAQPAGDNCRRLQRQSSCG
jgi:hypothetical protein